MLESLGKILKGVGVINIDNSGLPNDIGNRTGYVSDVVSSLMYIVGALAVIMIVYGGIQYVISGGDQAKVTKAKTTIIWSAVGLAVAILAWTIVTFVQSNVGAGSVEELVGSIANTMMWIAGALAVIMIVYAAFLYITSAGDSAKVQKAKNALKYAIVGVIVAILAGAITAFVINAVK